MDLLRSLLATVVAGGDPGPFALLRREGADHVDVLRGELAVVATIAEIPLPAGPAGPHTLALVPYRQLAEHGLPCVDDGTPLECLRLTGHHRVPLADLVARLASTTLPTSTTPLAGAGRFDLDDEQYAELVRTVLRDEIGRGEGANFVLHRTYLATVQGPPLAAGLAALGRLLVDEPGAYWAFLVHTGTRTLVGATPERHVSVASGQVTMNPISGTHRLSAPRAADPADLLRFLADPKETDELYMVLDEELKMMARLAADGGGVHGPRLKRMAHLVHTEYLLTGRGDVDVRDALRETMFAPTVTGSPLRNALRVIARHEGRGRRYYSGVAALLGRDAAGRQTLDAPILIRTAELTADGVLRVPVGATLVRHSTPRGEVAETHTKATGILAAFGLRTGPTPDTPPAPRTPRSGVVERAAPDDGIGCDVEPGVAAALAARNTHLARFWLDRPALRDTAVPALRGRTALVVDAEDAFAVMLAHLLRALGLRVTVRPWQDLAPVPDSVDLLVIGPGPGDPRATRDTRRAGRTATAPGAGNSTATGAGLPTWIDADVPVDAAAKMDALRGLLTERLESGLPLLAVCLGQQLLAGLLGLRLHRRERPHQGLARTVDLFGRPRRVGFYSTFTALADADDLTTAHGRVRIARDPADGTVHALRGATFSGLQFHPESVLSQDGLAILRDDLTDLLAPCAPVQTGTAGDRP
ncbi:Anthranilate synthase, phenazine specific [Frankia canadensis]|uniref:anthranilate synthase n=1 Tax=Frankia canadensis TaxID=1836972 RepID=A0A2I2KKA3_9ACTN|nr:anthranilate synthase family protein [Frankia canadensis]SNQ46102.1 Anthranilate synthase, phenazine specific [Frankia canadensis]SOU53392.1 Anthranilate synthase, phenazine specific [Frankia canadensis]